MSRSNDEILKEMHKFAGGKNDWQDEWDNMPEFMQMEKKPWKEIKVKFKREEDYIAFAKLLDQNLTDKTSVVWYPKIVKGKVCKHANKVYVDES